MLVGGFLKGCAMTITTDKMVARAIIIRRKRGKTYILLVRKQNEPDTFELPGGRRKHRETFVQALIRELFEEVNLRVNQKDCFKWGAGVMRTTHDHGRSVRVQIYRVTATGRTKAKNEIIECQYVDIKKLVETNLERKTKIILWLYLRFTDSFR